MNISEVRNMIRINRHRLDDELEINAQVMEEIGRTVSRLNGVQLELKRKLAIAEAKAISELKEADPKMSNPIAEKEAARDRDVNRAWEAWQGSRAELEEWESVQKAWYQRGFDLKALGDLFAHQYFAMDSIRGPYPSGMESLRGQMREASGNAGQRRHQADEGRARGEQALSNSTQQENPRPRRRTLVDS